jgi:protein-tyrosine phosphatase
MNLDYTSGCVNFRDVGLFVNWLANEKLLPENKLFRGGSIDFVKDLADINQAKTIINLRQRADYQYFNVNYLHFPIANQTEKYNTSDKEVRKWLNHIIQVFENEQLEYPVLIHCLSGKDRTGIVIAAILKVLGIQEEIIIQEYLLSEGELHLDLFKIALAGFNDLETYFKHIDLKRVINNINT